jgi:hypothetical protein
MSNKVKVVQPCSTQSQKGELVYGVYVFHLEILKVWKSLEAAKTHEKKTTKTIL